MVVIYLNIDLTSKWICGIFILNLIAEYRFLRLKGKQV